MAEAGMMERIVQFFVDNEGKIQLIDRFLHNNSINLNTTMKLIRSTHQTMAAGQHSRTITNHSCDLSVLLPVRWSAVHEKPKTVRTKKYLDRVQCRSSCTQRGAGYRGMSQKNILLYVLSIV